MSRRAKVVSLDYHRTKKQPKKRKLEMELLIDGVWTCPYCGDMYYDDVIEPGVEHCGCQTDQSV